MSFQTSDQLRRTGHRGVLSKSMPPKFVFTRDEEIKAVRMHLKKKRSQQSIGSSFRSSSSTQRTFLDSDLDSSINDPAFYEDELEQLFKRKQSLTLDERIALKKEGETKSTLSVETITKDQSNQNIARKLVSLSSDISSESIYNVPEYQSVDSIPLSYTADEASSVLRAYNMKLASLGRIRSLDSKGGLTKNEIVKQDASKTGSIITSSRKGYKHRSSDSALEAFEDRLKRKLSNSCRMTMCFEPRVHKQKSLSALEASSRRKTIANDVSSRTRLTVASKSEPKHLNSRRDRGNTRVSQSMNDASFDTSWSDLGAVIDLTLSISLLETN